MQFDGVDDFVELPFIFDPDDDFTISFWFKRSDYGTDASDVVLSQADGDSPGEVGRTILKISGQDGTTPREIFFDTYLTGGQKRMKQGVEINKWTHITLVHDADENVDGSFYWYYNGIKHTNLLYDGIQSNVSANGVISNNDGIFFIGKNNDATQFFKGEIDELRIWNTTKTLDQVKNDIHNSPTLDTSLIAYYNMNTVTQTILINDSSYGNAYNGNLNGALGVSANPNDNIRLTTFAYEKNTYSKAEKNPSPIILGKTGGVFSSSSGISINSSTGEIDLSFSSAGTYNINYSISGSCAASSSKPITITASKTVDFTYDLSLIHI